MTVAYIEGLVEPGDLERLVLAPLARRLPAGPPDALLRSGRFPAPHLRVAAGARALHAGLLAGLAAVHVDGHAGALLVGAGGTAGARDGFTANLDANLALLRQALRHPRLRVEVLDSDPDRRRAVAYLHGVATPETVQAVRAWAGRRRTEPPRAPWWRALPELFRVPPAVAATAPAGVAAALNRGYVAVLASHQAGALLLPSTLELLLCGPGDLDLPPAVRRLTGGWRTLAALVALTLCSSFVAVVAYHHSLLPAPFLVALASGRQNPPFPVLLEVLLTCVLGDILWAVALRLGGQRFTLLAYTATVLGAMLALQAGVVGPVPAAVAVASATLAQVLPTVELSRAVRTWVYVFFAAAAGLGMYGMSLVAFALLVYLGQERPLGHPLRCPPAGVSR